LNNESCDVLQGDPFRRKDFDDLQSSPKKVALIPGVELLSCEAVGLTGDSSNENINAADLAHESAELWACKGVDVRPDRCLSQCSCFHLRNQI
jgi:hypothetical protein